MVLFRRREKREKERGGTVIRWSLDWTGLDQTSSRGSPSRARKKTSDMELLIASNIL
jgi:hypothetical protein